MLLLDKYKLKQPVGFCDYPMSYQATEIATGKEVIIQKFGCDDKNKTGLPLLSQLKTLSHTSLVPIYEQIFWGEDMFVIFEAVNEPLIAEFIEERDPSLEAVLSLFKQMAEVLGYLHKQGIFHKDIHPAHFCVKGSDHLQLTHLGLVSQPEQHLNSFEMDLQLQYISPEQASGLCLLDAQSNVYSLGLVFYQVLTRQLPFPVYTSFELKRSLLIHQPLPAHRLLPGLPIEISALLSLMLCQNPKHRGKGMPDIVQYISRIESTFSLEILNKKSSQLFEGRQCLSDFFRDAERHPHSRVDMYFKDPKSFDSLPIETYEEHTNNLEFPFAL